MTQRLLPTPADPDRVKRTKRLQVALKTSDTFRQFMSEGRAADPLRNEEELWWMLLHEMQRQSGPRRSMVKRLHGAIVNIRQKREWAELQATLDKMVSA